MNDCLPEAELGGGNGRLSIFLAPTVPTVNMRWQNGSIGYVASKIDAFKYEECIARSDHAVPLASLLLATSVCASDLLTFFDASRDEGSEYTVLLFVDKTSSY